MGRTIKISESMESMLIRTLLEEGERFYPDGEKVLLLKKYLDSNILVNRGLDDIDNNGRPKKTTVFSIKGSDGQPMNTMDASELFYYIQDEFDGKLYKNDNQRDRFINAVLKDWVNGRISDEGLLSVNFY